MRETASSRSGDAGASPEIIPIKERNGLRTYVTMQPYIREPKLTLTVGLYEKPKQYADQQAAIGQTIGQPNHEGFKQVQLGTAEAILSRFTKSGPLHPVYKAAMELGKVRQTIFVCEYLGSKELRQEGREWLNVIENWNSANSFA